MNKIAFMGPEKDFGLSDAGYLRFAASNGAERLSPTSGDGVFIHYFDQQKVTIRRTKYFHEEDIFDEEQRHVTTKRYHRIQLRLYGPEEGISEIEQLMLDEEKKAKFRSPPP